MKRRPRRAQVAEPADALRMRVSQPRLPLTFGPWARIRDEVVAEVTERVFEGAGVHAASGLPAAAKLTDWYAMPCPFADGSVLVQATCTLDGAKGIVDAWLQGCEGTLVLTGQAEEARAVSGFHSDSTNWLARYVGSYRVQQYLHFFNAAVCGADGRFRPVQKVEELEQLGGRDIPSWMAEQLLPIQLELTPPRLRRREGDLVARASMHVLVGGSLHFARYKMFPNGSIEMTDDVKVATDIAPAERWCGAVRNLVGPGAEEAQERGLGRE
jgi:hypothetical protein